jgi:glycosyltransferase involved in cell wall biosynthesis
VSSDSHVSSDDSILVLTTEEKNWWWSMAEILPTIERVWTGIGESGRAHVRMLCVPLTPDVERDLRAAADCTRVIVTAVTPGTVAAALLLRQRMNVAVPMILYLYGDATEGLHAFGAIADVLTERDVFVVSSDADAAATRCCFPSARITVIPFPVADQFKVRGGERVDGAGTARLAYVGRVSEQKNLHTLLFALWILRTSGDPAPDCTLDVYGREDDLGSPNMGIGFPNYGAYLQDLAKSLSLDDVVTWHGFTPRDQLFDDLHTQPHIFVSPTLHSDENFGSSVLASLVNGHQVVTTAWGGHFGFQEWFADQLTLVPVHRSTMGPVVDPVRLADAVRRSIVRSATVVVDDAALDRARAAFSRRTVTARTLALLDRTGGEPVPLRKSADQRHLDEQRIRFGGGRKIFVDYADPVAQLFFEAYGMTEPLVFDRRASYLLPPWVSCDGNVLRVDDPHRGPRSARLDTGTGEPLDVTACPSMETFRLPASLVDSLVTQGYAFPDRPTLGGIQDDRNPLHRR